MAKFSILTAVLALASSAAAQCGSGSPHARVTGSGTSFTATKGSTDVYTGTSYLAAIQAALDSVSSGQRVAVIASGSIGAITMNLSGGLGIRFDRDRAANSNVKMGVVRVTGAGSHAVETWNIDGLAIDQVIARNVGEAGLLIQKTTNATVGLVDGDNVGASTGYGTLRFANNNGQRPDGSYATNIYVDKVVSRGGGRGVFCVSQSGAAEIGSVDLADNGSNAVLVENCYNLSILGGSVSGGGEVRLAARSEFPNNRDISITLKVDGTTVRESPCGENVTWKLSGGGARSVC